MNEYDGIGSDHIHKFIIGKNSEKIPIVVCEKCNKSRLWVMTFEKDRRDEGDRRIIEEIKRRNKMEGE